MKQMKNQKGFTLVEIAIVLVIIGLLLGGVLKGQELITNAKVKNLANIANSISAAYYAYQDRYHALPGDDVNAATRFSTQDCGGAACGAGNGNGQIGGAWNSTTNTDESRLIWQHLRASGLLKGDGGATVFEQPRHTYGGRVGVQWANSYGISNNNLIFLENIGGRDAQLLDNMNDDAFMNTGSWRAVATAGAGVPYVETTTYTPAAKL